LLGPVDENEEDHTRVCRDLVLNLMKRYSCNGDKPCIGPHCPWNNSVGDNVSADKPNNEEAESVNYKFP